MQKQVLFGKEAREKIKNGVEKIVNAVSVTMGAAGKCVLIGNAEYGTDGLYSRPTIVTKDGYTVTKYFELPDAVENRGAMIIKEAALKTVDQAGDATTCTCVLAGSIIKSGLEVVNNGANSQEVKKGIEHAVYLAVEKLKQYSIKVSGDNNRIKQVATVSANNDESIGSFIAEAYEKIGHDGIIDIVQSNGRDTIIKVADGFKIDKGWVSQLFVNNKPKDICEFEDAYILLYDKRITHHTQIQRALEICNQRNVPLVIICEDADGEGLATLVMNNVNQRIRVCVVKSPGFGDNRTEQMEDIALLTGGHYVSDIRGINIKEIEEIHFGKAKKVVISKDETVIIGGQGSKALVSSLIDNLKENLKNVKTEEEKYPIEKRIAKLNGGVAVIEVGAATESELGEKLDRYDDAVRATKAAISEGFVAGGGSVFSKISKELSVPTPQTDFELGVNIVAQSLNAPLIQIIENAGIVKSDGIVKEVRDSNYNIGYNVKTDSVENLIDSGIIDSSKALRCALVNAASVAGVAITSECLIVTVS